MKLLSRLAYHDGLTDMLNRTSYMEEIKNISSNGYPELLVAIFDVNNLKFVNDTYGHIKGDELIKSVADCLQNNLSDLGKCYRIGGDEFVLIVNGAKEDELSCLVERWSKVIKIMNETAKNCICEVAVGYASGSGKDIENVKNMADYRMYENKQRNKKSKIINS